MNQPEIIAEGLSWPESPRWHDDALWFADVHHFRLMKVRPGEPAQVVAQVPGRPSGMGFMPDGRLLLATALDKKLCWVSETGQLTLAVDLSGHVTGLLNDMIVDATGRAWVGDTGFDFGKGETPKPGRLLTWAPESGVAVAVDGVSFPNGLVMSDDHRILYLAESFGKRISVFDVHAHGRLQQRQQIALEDGPDGLCLDAEGAFWVPLPMKQEFQRVTMDGRVTHRIAVGKERAIACVLGGEDRRSLFLGSSEMDDSDKTAIKRKGVVRVLRVDVPGAGLP